MYLQQRRASILPVGMRGSRTQELHTRSAPARNRAMCAAPNCPVLKKDGRMHREPVVREAFKDQLKGWGMPHNLVVEAMNGALR